VIRAGFRAPSPEAIAADQDALRRGEHLIVACYLKGFEAPYPKRRRGGELELSQEQVCWRASWSLRRGPLVIDTPVRSLDVRAADASDWNLKKGGKAFGLIPIPEIQLIEATTDVGVVEFGVPSWDVPLVTLALRGDNQ
jgi:hypothetical protein